MPFPYNRASIVHVLRVVGVIMLFAALATLSDGLALCSNDLGVFFIPSANVVLAGHPLDIYQIRSAGNPNVNGPIGTFLLALVLGVGRLLGLQHVPPRCVLSGTHMVLADSLLLRIWVNGIFALIAYGIMVEFRHLAIGAKAWRKLGGDGRYIIWSLLLLNPLFWIALVEFGHPEQIVALWLALLGTRILTAERPLLGGLLIGLAIMARTTTVFVAIPLVCVLLYQRQWRSLLAFLGMATATIGAILLPFLLHARHDLIFSLLTFREIVPILDGSFWTILRGTHAANTLKTWDVPLALLVATLTSVLLVWRERVKLGDPTLYSIICISTCCFPLFVKVVWTYYYLDPFIWVVAWVLVSPTLFRGWRTGLLLPLAFIALGLFTEARVHLVPNMLAEAGGTRAFVIIQSLVASLAIAALVVLIAHGILYGKVMPTKFVRRGKEA